MFETNEIRRRPDGSIDTHHYVGAGKDCRSRAAKRVIKRLAKVAPRWTREIENPFSVAQHAYGESIR